MLSLRLPPLSLPMLKPKPLSDIISLHDLTLINVSYSKALELIQRCIAQGNLTQFVFVNAHVVSQMLKDPSYRGLLATTMNWNDGVGIALAARMRRQRFCQNLNGTDFIPHLLSRAARQHWPVYIYGGRQKSLEATLARARREHPDLKIAGHNGYDPIPSADLCERIRHHGTEILLVALGVPDQDFWIKRFQKTVGCPVAMGVGAFVDYYGGTRRRAPRLWRQARLEWLWRLLSEPRRLWRRYLWDAPRFLWWAMTVRGDRG